jgi:hypothetical protein
VVEIPVVEIPVAEAEILVEAEAPLVVLVVLVESQEVSVVMLMLHIPTTNVPKTGYTGLLMVTPKNVFSNI